MAGTFVLHKSNLAERAFANDSQEIKMVKLDILLLWWVKCTLLLGSTTESMCASPCVREYISTLRIKVNFLGFKAYATHMAQ